MGKINMFQFQPLQTVTVTAFGLGYLGRICQCVLRANDRIVYEVDYAAEGEIRRGEFFADELEAR